MGRRTKPSAPPVWRQYLVLGVMTAVFVTLGVRVIVLQVEQQEMLQAQGDKRYLREVRIPPERGKIVDRNGQVLSVSTPVETLAADPKIFCVDASEWKDMPKVIGLDQQGLKERCKRYLDSDFMYIKRQLPPHIVAQVMDMKIPGVEVRREYKRYFPGGPVSAHLIGFTDVEDQGQEGVELRLEAEGPVVADLLQVPEARSRVARVFHGRGGVHLHRGPPGRDLSRAAASPKALAQRVVRPTRRGLFGGQPRRGDGVDLPACAFPVSGSSSSSRWRCCTSAVPRGRSTIATGWSSRPRTTRS